MQPVSGQRPALIGTFSGKFTGARGHARSRRAASPFLARGDTRAPRGGYVHGGMHREGTCPHVPGLGVVISLRVRTRALPSVCIREGRGKMGTGTASVLRAAPRFRNAAITSALPHRRCCLSPFSGGCIADSLRVGTRALPRADMRTGECIGRTRVPTCRGGVADSLRVRTRARPAVFAFPHRA
jgi:hypothetical protein